MTKATKQAKHMSTSTNINGKKRGKAGIVALALAGVLAVGGVSAVCVAGLGKSPGQAPVAAQQAAPATKATTKASEKPAAQQAQQQSKPDAQPQQQAKPAMQQAQQQAKPAVQQAQQQSKPAAQPQQQQQAKPAAQPQPQQQAKPAAQPQQQPQPAAQPQQQAAPVQAEGSGLEAKLSREAAIALASDHLGGGAQNVSARGPVTGGGTVYYVVELDKDDAHYSVTVDAIDGGVINSDKVQNGTRVLLDKDATPMEGTEQPADA